MCLGIPGLVLDMVDGYADQIALVDVVGKARKINVGMLQTPVGPGDWVLIHMGFAVEIVSPADAEKALSGLEMMGRPRDTEELTAP
jgi:hydrogenase assembly chaperone HypC/HupF